MIVDTGLNFVLEAAFGSGTYIGLIDNDPVYSAIAAGDTMSSHAGWHESESYDEADRQAWTTNTAASKSITTTASSEAVFTCSAAETMKGACLCSNNTKGGATGTLIAATLFTGGDQAVVDDDTIEVTWTITAADS